MKTATYGMVAPATAFFFVMTRRTKNISDSNEECPKCADAMLVYIEVEPPHWDEPPYEYYECPECSAMFDVFLREYDL